VTILWGGWKSVSDGRAAPGTTVTAVGNNATFPRSEQVLFVTNPDGWVYTTTGSAEGDWGEWTPVSEGRAAPGTTVTVGADPLLGYSGPPYDLFITNPDGWVYTTSGSAEGGWRRWKPVSEGRTAPGTTVTAVLDQWPRYALFIANPNGEVFTTSGSTKDGWGEWSRIPFGLTAPGTTVTAVPEPSTYRYRRFHVFITKPSGEVVTTSGNVDSSWDEWTSISQGRAAPGTTVTSDYMPFPLRQLFITNPDGWIYTNSGSAEGGWGGWKTVSEGRAAPGTTVGSAYPWQALFITDPNGDVFYTMAGIEGGWGEWKPVSEGRAAPGTAVTVLRDVWRYPYRYLLFITNPDGWVYSISGSES
jgi:hypothetical protein